MNAQVLTRRQGLALILVTLLITVLLVGPAWARKEMQIGIEGDPGDGNLSPSAYADANTSGGGSAGVSPGTFSGSSYDSGRISMVTWIVPLPGTPFGFAGPVDWLFLRPSAAGLRPAAFLAPSGRGYSHAR